jgi:hypothetical protein
MDKIKFNWADKILIKTQDQKQVKIRTCLKIMHSLIILQIEETESFSNKE